MRQTFLLLPFLDFTLTNNLISSTVDLCTFRCILKDSHCRLVCTCLLQKKRKILHFVYAPRLYLCAKWHVSKCSESSLFATKPKAEDCSKVHRVAVLFKHTLLDWRNRRSGTSCNWLYIWSNKQRSRSEIQTPAHWKLIGRSMTASPCYRPALFPSINASLCSHTRKKKCGRVSKFDFIIYCFWNCVGWRFYSVKKHINKSFFGGGGVWYLTPLHYPK